MLDGLEGAAASAGGGFDRQKMEQILAGLGNRVFLMNNIHEDAAGGVPDPLGHVLPARAAHPQPDQDADGPV